MQARKHIPKKARATGKTKVFTEEEDADENGRIAVILRIVQHHCVTKIIGFDVIYGYICRYGNNSNIRQVK